MNIYTDTYHQLKEECSSMPGVETWDGAYVISLPTTCNVNRVFNTSDIIICYEDKKFTPFVITERIYRKNYTPAVWGKYSRLLRKKVQVLNYEHGYHVKLSCTRDYMDYIHYKEDWWLCVESRALCQE